MKYVAALGIIILIAVFAYINKDRFPNQNSLPKTTDVVTDKSDGKTKISPKNISDIPFTITKDFTIHVFASGLGNPRDLQYSPEGTLLVSSPNSGTIYALPDKNKDGVADNNITIISGEAHPHGLAFYGNKLYIAEVNKVVRYNWDEANLKATKDKDLFFLPENNNHNNRTLVFDSNGKMYVSVGSTCNVCNEKSNLSATVIVSDADGNNPTVFARGLRNSPFVQFNVKTGELWGTEMGRDNLGDNIPPDEINIIKQNTDYGWPNCYGSKIPDTNFNPSATCQNTQIPVYQIPAHSAPLGLTFIDSVQFPSDWQGDLLVAYHGSWNRSTPSGYKVFHLKVSGSTITDSEDFLTGFISSSAVSGSSALGRPVDLTFDSLGSLYLSDDKSGNVYIIQKK